MKFKVDENLPAELAAMLRDGNHDAVTINEQSLTGARDYSIASICRREARILVTLDLDFADIRSYPPKEYHGLIVLRLRRGDKPHVLDVFRRFMNLLPNQRLEGCLLIVEEDRLRIRT